MLKAEITLIALLCGFTTHPAPAAAQSGQQVIAVFDQAMIEWDPVITQVVSRDGYQVLKSGQLVQTIVDLPAAGSGQAVAPDRQIIAKVQLEPVMTEVGGQVRPGDPWTRLGTVSI